MIQGINTKTIIAGKTFKQIAEDRREEYLDDRTIPSISFKELFGDLSQEIYCGSADLNELHLNSLEGFPERISGNRLSVELNRDLTSFDFFPKSTATYELCLDHNLFCEFAGAGLSLDSFKKITIFIHSFDLYRDLVPEIVNIWHSKSGDRTLLSEKIKILDTECDWLNEDNLSLDYVYKMFKAVDYDKKSLARVLSLL